MTDNKRPRSPSYHEVVKLALAQGVKAVRDLEPKPSRRSLRKALDELISLGKQKLAKDFEAELLPPKPQGAVAPAVGEKKGYRVQLQNGQEYVRLPVKTLGVKQGDHVVVHFEKNRIVTKAA